MRLIELVRNSIESRKRLAIFFTFIAMTGLVILVGRRFLPTERTYLFLIWNFFLATIPLLISSLMLEMKNKQYPAHNIRVLGFFWLMFLPNAPYMLTDYIHLSISRGTMIWLDMLTISWFAVSAFIIAIISLNDVATLLSGKYTALQVSAIVFSICVVAGFGIYLGRDLRFNTWDIVLHPMNILRQIIHINPSADYPTLIAGNGIGFFMFIVYLGFGMIRKELNWSRP